LNDNRLTPLGHENEGGRRENDTAAEAEGERKVPFVHGYSVGDVLANGKTVLEVDEHGPVVLSKRPREART
jgi:hypothetical protein